MVASLVTLFKKLKFVTDENVGWGPIDLPELELQTTAYWLTAEDAGARLAARRSGRRAARRRPGDPDRGAVLLMVDPRDLGLVTQVRSPHQEAPTIYLYEAMPGGVGLSERLLAAPRGAGRRRGRPDRGVRLRRAAVRRARARASSRRSTRKALALRLLAAARRVGARRRGERRMTMSRGGASRARGGWRTCGATLARRPAARRSGRTSRRRAPAVAGRRSRGAGGAPGGRRSTARSSRRTSAASWCAGPSPRSRCRIDRERLARLPGQPPRGRAARLPRHGDDRARDRRRAPGVPRRPRLVGGPAVPPGPAAAAGSPRGARRCSHVLAARIPPDAWLVTYNGRGFDWPLLVARYRMVARGAPPHAGHLDLLTTVRRMFRHRMADARLRTAEEALLGVSAGSATSRAGRSRAATSTFLRGGAGRRRSRRCRRPQRAGRPVARAGCSPMSSDELGDDGAAPPRRPRGDLLGLARAFGRTERHEERSPAWTTRWHRRRRPRSGRADAGRARRRAGAPRGRRDAWWTSSVGRPTAAGHRDRAGGATSRPAAAIRSATLGAARDRRAGSAAAGPTSGSRPSARGCCGGSGDGRGGGGVAPRRPPARSGRDRVDRAREGPGARRRDLGGALAATRDGVAARCAAADDRSGRSRSSRRTSRGGARDSAAPRAPPRRRASRATRRACERPSRMRSRTADARRNAEQAGRLRSRASAAARHAAGRSPARRRSPMSRGSTWAANSAARNVSPAPVGSTTCSTGIGG